MICEKCGKESPEGTKFCGYCGNQMKKDMSMLIERAKQNDQAALAEIYRCSSSSVYRVIKVLIKDDDTVNDILQDTYVKAFTRLDQLQNSERLIPWLKMIANNTAKDWLKKSKPVFFSEISNSEETDGLSFEEAIESTDTEVNPEMAMDEKEVRRLVMEILDQLPEDQRMVIGMFYYEEMSVKDIAESLGVSENTVKSRLLYGRKKIKEQVLELEKQGTKLYSIAPFVFFLYLLRRTETVQAGTMEKQALQKVMESGICTASNRISENAVSQMSHSTMNDTTMNGMSKATSKTITGVAGKTAARHVGVKVASLILVGAVGAGGITYGVVKNWDRLPFAEKKMEVNQKSEQTEELKENTEPTPTLEAEKTSDSEAGESTKTQEKEQTLSVTEERALYKTFYENYVRDQNLRVIPDGLTDSYDLNVGYTDDLLLGACVQDFGGDGKQELLLVRTKGKEKDEVSSNYTAMEKVLYLELYGLDGDNVQTRQYYEVPYSDLNSRMDGIEEQIGIRQENDGCYVERYGIEHPGTGASLSKYTFVKITDTDLQQVDTLKFMFGATYGECTINGEKYDENYRIDDVGAAEQDVHNVLQKYNLDIGDVLGEPLISGVYRVRDMGAQYFSQNDTFTVRNDFVLESDQASEPEQAEESENTEATETIADPTTEALKLIEGTWYTFGGMPYHFKIIFEGNDLKAYDPSGVLGFERTVSEVTKTDYGYFFRISYEYGDYGYRWDMANPETLSLVSTSNPYSTEGYSGTDSLVRNK